MAKASSDSGTKMVPADCVSVLLIALGNTSISMAQYDMMSALDGTRTASAFQHQFRSITQKARELKQRVDSGETFAPVAPSKKRGTGSTDEMTPPATPKKPKASPKPRAKKSKAKGSDDDNSPNNNLGSGFNKQERGNGIKQEQEWDQAEV